MVIQNVYTEAFNRMRGKWFFWFFVVLGFLGFLFPFSFSFFVVAIFLYVWEWMHVLKEFMQQFAQGNGYTFLERGSSEDISILHGSLFDEGAERSISNIITGNSHGYPIRLFNYSFVINSGKNRQKIQHTVFELTFKTNLPNIFLIGKGYWKQFDIRTSEENLKFSSHPKKVSLGKGYDDFFQLFVPEKYEIEALQIFNYEILSTLAAWRNTLGGFALEFTEDKLYIYFCGIVTNAKKLYAMHELAELIITRFSEELRRMKPGLDAQEEVFERLSKK